MAGRDIAAEVADRASNTTESQCVLDYIGRLLVNKIRISMSIFGIEQTILKSHFIIVHICMAFCYFWLVHGKPHLAIDALVSAE